MDWKTSLDWYCSGNDLELEDIELLENQYQLVIKGLDKENSFELAPKHICNQTKINDGSSWISAVAVVLDRLKPLENGNPRSLIIDQISRYKSS